MQTHGPFEKQGSTTRSIATRGGNEPTVLVPGRSGQQQVRARALLRRPGEPLGPWNRGRLPPPGSARSGDDLGTMSSTPRPTLGLTLVAWAILLAASLLPVIVSRELLGSAMGWAERGPITCAVIVVGLVVTSVVTGWRPLRPFLLVLLALVGAQWLVFTQLGSVPAVRALTRDSSFAVFMLAELALNLVVTLVVVAVLFAIHRDRHAFYLAKGDTSAPAGPIGWMGVKTGDRWNALGRNLTIAISLGTVAFLALSGQPSVDLVVRALPLLPVILLAAAVNAFNEEVSYKASLLSVLVGPIGPRQALWMVAAYFGIAHFYGIPYGLVGVALAWFLGWILARSMLETRGLTWAWFIHFVQDVLIFGFLAMGAVSPGG